MKSQTLLFISFAALSTNFLFTQEDVFALVGELQTYSHTFRYYAPQETNVSIVGDFNKWNAEKGRMTKTESGYWEKQVTLESGFQSYAFLKNGILVRDPDNNDIVTNSSKQWVSLLFIPPTDEVVFPDELENDLRNIQFELFNAPPFYFYKKFPEKVMEVNTFPTLSVDLNVTKSFSNVMFEFTIYNKQGAPLTTRSRMGMSFNKLYDMVFYFEKELERPDHIVFRLKTKGKECQAKRDIKTFRFHGRVTDFDENPVDGAYVYAGGLFVYCDPMGYFEMDVSPSIHRRNWACCKAYRDTRLENYFIDLVIDKDTEMDFKLGALEVYQLNVAPISLERIIQGQFIVWSISSVRGFKGQGDIPKHPEITPEEVSIFLNGKLAELKILNKVKRLGDNRRTELDAWYFEALVPRDAKKLDRNELKVVIEHKAADERGKPIVEKGQAQFLNLLWP
ncbi:MAG: early set domain-containing protein [Planctomycetota bacterium]